MHITTVSLIKRHISKMPEGRLFHTSELLNYGARGTVDQNLRRLWLKGFIIKVARALWVKAVDFQPAKTPVPPVLEIAWLKAGAFKKEITSLVKQVTDGTFEFMSAGRHSSFGSCHGRVYFRQASMRKISLGRCMVGTTLLEMWNAGPRKFANYLPVLANFSRQDREELRKLISTLPQWLRGPLSLLMRSGP